MQQRKSVAHRMPCTQPSDDEVQRFFDRANSLENAGETVELYTQWAPLYDDTIGRFGRYLSPGRVSGILSESLPARDSPILDVACGSGLLGEAIWRRGFRNIVGLDLTPAMLARAQAKGVYRHLVSANLLSPLPFRRDLFEAVVCVGAFGPGHVGAAALGPILAVIKPGGLLICDVEIDTWRDDGFESEFENLRAKGLIVGVSRELGRFLDSEPLDEAQGWFVTTRKEAPS